ncbi:MAG: ribonuclease III [Patescibacteria group bacterium]
MNPDELEALARELKIKFKDVNLLLQAVTHRSYINENPGCPVGHNERLEFLGDAVLELVVTEHLYALYPEKPEGELTSYRAALVNAEMLADVASDLGVNSYMLLSRGEKKDTGRARHYILANAFEAIVGAIYLDRGYDSAQKFIARVLFLKIKDVVEKKLWKDPKSTFQEGAQEHAGVTPNYKVLKEVGPDHAKKFSVGVYLGHTLVAEGAGLSKQEAEVEAAKAALIKKGWG